MFIFLYNITLIQFTACAFKIIHFTNRALESPSKFALFPFCSFLGYLNQVMDASRVKLLIQHVSLSHVIYFQCPEHYSKFVYPPPNPGGEAGALEDCLSEMDVFPLKWEKSCYWVLRTLEILSTSAVNGIQYLLMSLVMYIFIKNVYMSISPSPIFIISFSL